MGETHHILTVTNHAVEEEEHVGCIGMDESRHHLSEEVAIDLSRHGLDIGLSGSVREADLRLVEQTDRIAHRTVSQERDRSDRLGIDSDILLVCNQLEAGREARLADSLEVIALTSRQDRCGQAMGFGRREDEDRMRGRLLQCLQQRVKGTGREHMNLVNNIDLVLGSGGEEDDLFGNLANVVDRVVGGGVNLGDIR